MNSIQVEPKLFCLTKKETRRPDTGVEKNGGETIVRGGANIYHAVGRTEWLSHGTLINMVEVKLGNEESDSQLLSA